jgi:uncharacterized repeat protein (TIGR01451 family)
MKKLFATLTLFSLVISAFATGVVATAVGTNPTCYGSCNGSATAMAGAGVGPYGFTWTGPSGYTGAGANISGLCAGTYIVTAIDSSDMSTAQYTIVLSQPGMLAATTTGSGTICAGACAPLNGYATGGAGGPYTYSWSPAAGLSSTTIANPVACPAATTTYTLTATDANGCTAVANATVTVIPNPVITVTSPVICQGQTGTLFASGGSTYSWSAGATSSGANSASVSPSSTTSYTVTGASGACTATAVSTVTVNPVPVVTASATPASCGVCNGSVAATASPAPATYSWTGPAGYTATITNPVNLCPGTYTVTATHTGCASMPYPVTVATSSPVTATVGSVVPASCGMCNGGATVSVTGGVPPYAYLWGSAPGVTTSTAVGLCPGSYMVSVTDANGCVANLIVTIPNSTVITSMISTTPTACGICNGSANVTASGGTAPYTYDWVPGTPAGDGTPAISALCTGTYTVTVTDASGCVSFASASIVNSNPVYVTSTAAPSACGACNGTVTVIGSGGVAPYTYGLSNGSLSQANGNFTSVCSGAYVATVTDTNGCSGIYTILVPSTNTSGFSAGGIVQNESGYGLHDGSVDLTITGSTGPYTFAWSNGAITEDIYSLAPGSYTVTVTDSNSDCATYTYTITTAPSYGFISGYVYNDNNGNCVYDAGDAPLSGYYVSASSGTATNGGFSNSLGYYNIWVPNGSYMVMPGTTAGLAAACTSSYVANVTGGSTIAGNDFAYALPPFYDVCIYTWANGIVPGFNGYYYVYLQNYGNQSATGVAYLVLPSTVNYTSASPAPASISGDTIFWNYTSAPYTTTTFTVNYHTPATAVLGTVTTAHVNATVTNGTDINPACNSYTYTRYVSGSFDPNEKTVSPSGTGVTGDIPLTEDEFTYLVRFQNTGSGPAVNINVTDTLSAMLDPLSLQVLNASHNYVVEMLPGNVIRWHFDNIMLPDSTSDEAGSHGHIQFRLAKLNAPVAGEVIENKAYIYFDFNAPVITNTAINTYNLAAALEEQFNENGAVAVYPNPFTDNTTFVIRSGKLSETYSFEMTDVVGKVVRRIKTNEKQFDLSRNGLQSGMYFYSITDAQGLVGMGKVIIK